MNKKRPVESIHSWWNLLSFARQFEVEVDTPPSVLAKQLSRLIKSDYNAYNRMTRSMNAQIAPIDPDKVYEFSLQIRRPFYGIPLTNIRANGRIVYSEGYQKTIMRGNIRVTALHYLLMGLVFVYTVAAIAHIATSGNASPIGVLVLMLALIGGMIWDIRQVYSDYQLLMGGIEEQVRAAIGAVGDEQEVVEDEAVDFYEEQQSQMRR
jgi:hypothetical protein